MANTYLIGASTKLKPIAKIAVMRTVPSVKVRATLAIRARLATSCLTASACPFKQMEAALQDTTLTTMECVSNAIRHVHSMLIQAQRAQDLPMMNARGAIKALALSSQMANAHHRATEL
jgi:hypothetical protein